MRTGPLKFRNRLSRLIEFFLRNEMRRRAYKHNEAMDSNELSFTCKISSFHLDQMIRRTLFQPRFAALALLGAVKKDNIYINNYKIYLRNS